MLQYATNSTPAIVWGSPVDFGAYPFFPSGNGKTDILVITTKDSGVSYHAGAIGRGGNANLGEHEERPPTFELSISTTMTNVDAATLFKQQTTWDGISPAFFRLAINSGAVVGSSSTSAYALTIANFPVGSDILLINDGYIVGKGGDGGQGGTYPTAEPDTAGHAGGPELHVQMQTTIQNNGIIGGGGGGGGGGGSTSYSNGTYEGGGGGGGGAGFAPGGGGVPGQNTDNSAQPGVAGGLSTGGSGGRGSRYSWAASGATSADGGRGGNLGQAGAVGIRGYSTTSGGTGGTPGVAITGQQNITWTTAGSIYGDITQ